MITTTNDVKEFFESSESPIYIYGAGNPGYWVGKYLHLCGMNYEGYFDKGARDVNCLMYGKTIYNPSEIPLVSAGENELRIIVAVKNVDEVLGQIHWYHNNRRIHCLIPMYEDYISKERIYDINKLLSFFRSKLLVGDVPTILSNSCNAGFIYRALGVKRCSPTINNIIWPNDFLKLCKNPEKYLSKDIAFSHWTLHGGKKIPVGKIDDIEVYFVHDSSEKTAIERWNTYRKRVDLNNLIYLFSEDMGNVPINIIKEFCRLDTKHLFILQKNMYCGQEYKGCVYMNHVNFHIRDSAWENWFDLVGWINGDIEI